MSSSQSATKTQLSCKNASSDYASKSASIVSRIGRVCTADSKKIQARALRFEDRTTANGTNLDTRH